VIPPGQRTGRVYGKSALRSHPAAEHSDTGNGNSFSKEGTSSLPAHSDGKLFVSQAKSTDAQSSAISVTSAMLPSALSEGEKGRSHQSSQPMAATQREVASGQASFPIASESALGPQLDGGVDMD